MARSPIERSGFDEGEEDGERGEGGGGWPIDGKSILVTFSIYF